MREMQDYRARAEAGRARAVNTNAPLAIRDFREARMLAAILPHCACPSRNSLEKERT